MKSRREEAEVREMTQREEIAKINSMKKVNLIELKAKAITKIVMRRKMSEGQPMVIKFINILDLSSNDSDGFGDINSGRRKEIPSANKDKDSDKKSDKKDDSKDNQFKKDNEDSNSRRSRDKKTKDSKKDKDSDNPKSKEKDKGGKRSKKDRSSKSKKEDSKSKDKDKSKDVSYLV